MKQARAPVLNREACIYDFANGLLNTLTSSLFLSRIKPLVQMTFDWLRAGGSEDQIPVGTRFSAPVQTGPGAHPASWTIGSGSFPGVKSGRGVTLTPHSLLVPWSWKGRAIPLLPLWAVRPVQSLKCLYKGDLYLYLLQLTLDTSAVHNS